MQLLCIDFALLSYHSIVYKISFKTTKYHSKNLIFKTININLLKPDVVKNEFGLLFILTWSGLRILKFNHEEHNGLF